MKQFKDPWCPYAAESVSCVSIQVFWGTRDLCFVLCVMQDFTLSAVYDLDVCMCILDEYVTYLSC